MNEVRTKEHPERGDEFAQDVSEFDTLAEYREDVKKKLAERKEADAKRTKEDEAIAKIIDKSKMEIPDPMIDMQVSNMLNDFANNMARQGLSMDQYLQFTGMTTEKLREQMRPDALKRIQSSLVLEKIAKEENIEVTDEDVDAKIEEMAKMYGMDAEQMKGYVRDEEKETIKRDIAVEKAVDLIMDNIKERAKASKKAKEEEHQEEQTTEQ